MARKEKRPWDTESTATRKAIILRLPLRTVAQLRYIAAREERTQQKCLDRILLPAIERQAEELWELEQGRGE